VPDCASETGAPTADLTGEMPPKPRSLIGASFGDYELLEEIGRGGMGIVFKARQKSLDRIVALKMLLHEQFQDPVRLARFLTEARTIAGLGHPNIVNVFQVGQSIYGHFFAMEYIDGQTLEAVIREKQQTPSPWAVSLLMIVGEAVHHAHGKGIIHRDLKPANIMIDRFRRPIVMDFGIAKFLGKASWLTQEGAILGTPAYMAPEQAGEDLNQVGPASDVYSLGAILYALLTGKPPYEAATPLQTVLKVIDGPLPPPPRSLRADVPAELDRICMKCLSKHPADRSPTVRALVDELRRFRTVPVRRKELNPPPAFPMITLVAEETGKEVRLTRPVTLMGRGTDCGLVVRASDVSKHHCQVVVESGQVVVEDLDSANGTFVNDKQVRRARLRDGDELRVADHVFRVRVAKE
jgi:serine/threonine protein kinase